MWNIHHRARLQPLTMHLLHLSLTVITSCILNAARRCSQPYWWLPGAPPHPCFSPFSSLSLIANVMRLICWSLIVNTLTSAAQNNSSSSSQWAMQDVMEKMVSRASDLSAPPLTGCVISQGRVHVWHLFSAQLDVSPLRARWELFPCKCRLLSGTDRLFFFLFPSLRLWNVKRESAAARWCVTFLLPPLNSHGCVFMFMLFFPFTTSIRRYSHTCRSASSGFLASLELDSKVWSKYFLPTTWFMPLLLFSTSHWKKNVFLLRQPAWINTVEINKLLSRKALYLN